MGMTRISVTTIGGFRMADASGRDLTPKSAKARGLLAILCLTPDRRRTRRWLESRLWSDRGPEQASGSLRQALTEIRRHLGPDRTLLLADREEVMLQADAFLVDLDSEPEATRQALGQGRELLEGLDVRDGEFQNWLCDERRRLKSGSQDPRNSKGVLPATSENLTLELLPSVDGAREENLLALALANLAGKLVSEFAVIDVIAPGAAQARVGGPGNGLRLRVDTIADKRRMHLLVRLEATASRQQLWSSHASVAGSGPEFLESAEFSHLAHHAAETALLLIPKLVGSDSEMLRAEAMMVRAMREMFTFDVARLRVAEGLLAETDRIAPSGRANAWRSLLRMFMFVERTEADQQLLRDEAEHFSARALEAEGDNSLVKAIVGKVRVLANGDVTGGAALAKDALSLNQSNPIGLSGLAAALMRGGRLDEALTLAQRGTHIARNSPFIHWWELFSCLAKIANGDFKGAISNAEAAHVRAPNFRAPLRHLYALYLHSDNPEAAHGVKTRLRALEPEFSLQNIRDNPGYPAGVLRASPLIALQDVE